MKKSVLLCVCGTLVLMASSARAQDATGAVPSLADVMSSMSSEEVSQMESDVSSGGSLSMDMDVTVETAVNDAVAEGLISAEQAEDAGECFAAWRRRIVAADAARIAAQALAIRAISGRVRATKHVI